MTTDIHAVTHCARCDQDHEAVEFKLFEGHPIVDSDGTEWWWWALCPVTGEPILMKKEDVPVIAPSDSAHAPQE